MQIHTLSAGLDRKDAEIAALKSAVTELCVPFLSLPLPLPLSLSASLAAWHLLEDNHVRLSDKPTPPP
jgi:hypothetical protein